jgi:large subunit ribosomal protein L2
MEEMEMCHQDHQEYVIGQPSLLHLNSQNCLATVGQVGNVGVNQKSLDRDGSKSWLDKRPVVRGEHFPPRRSSRSYGRI